MKHALLVLWLSVLFCFPGALTAQTKKPNTNTPAVMSSAYGEKLTIPGIPNPGKINDVLYRGAQPNEQGLSELKKLGITTIVDLRAEDRDKVEWERKQAQALGLRFVHIPIEGFAAPTNEEVARFLSLFRENAQQKVFVHCLLGKDRTGVFVASYRMAMEKWPSQQALQGMYSFGFYGFWHLSMKSFVQDFPARLTAAPALAGFLDLKARLPLPATSAN